MAVDYVRNKDGIWVNSQAFREDALHFQKYGYYCADPWGSPAWYEYWTDRRKRIMYGYESQGVKITADHYFYLNFCPILKTEDSTAKRSRKVTDFPDFWDGDYNYFWARDIAYKGVAESMGYEEEFEKFSELHVDSLAQALQLKTYLEELHLEIRVEKDYLRGGWNLIVGKSRRKGYSYKNAAIGVRNYLTRPSSLTIYAAYEKKFLYPKGIFTMALNYVNFINDNTAWAFPSDYINRNDHRKASYKEYKNGIETEKGFKSELMAVSFKDNADAVRGKDAVDLIFEESGAFGTPGLLKSSYAASEDCVKDGEIKTGMITIFGTSGDMEGGTADYAEMFNNPKRFSLLPMENIWEDDEKVKGSVGFFHPVNWNMPGFMDKQGNSDREGAKQTILDERKRLVDHGATSTDLQQKLQEKPLTPAEAFSYTTMNIFPTMELKRQRDIIIAKRWQQLKAQPVDIYRDPDTQKVVAKPIMKLGEIVPILTMEHTGSKRGCPIIYEYPVPNAPKGLYKIGYDPVRQDEGSSLAAIVVYKGTMMGEYTRDCVVAEFIGRRETPDDVHHIAELFALLYNTQVMYENEVPDVKTYFQRRKLLHLLALQPDAVISKNIKASKVSRAYGCHMNTQLKDAAERYAKQWLVEVRDFDENGNPITSIDTLYSLRLVEELLQYDKKGNYDLTSALFMCLFQVQEEVIGLEHEPGESKLQKNAKKLLEMAKRR